MRWSLAELRRALGVPDALAGDKPTLTFPPDTWIDVLAVTATDRALTVDLVELGGELLEGMGFPANPAFESWLLVERHHLNAASEGLLREAAMAALGQAEPRMRSVSRGGSSP